MSACASAACWAEALALLRSAPPVDAGVATVWRVCDVVAVETGGRRDTEGIC